MNKHTTLIRCGRCEAEIVRSSYNFIGQFSVGFKIWRDECPFCHYSAKRFVNYELEDKEEKWNS